MSRMEVESPPHQLCGITCISTPSFRFIEDCASQLDGEILKRFEKSCFGHFKHLPGVMFCSHLEEEEEDAMSFIIGSQEICFGEREFAMMSGLMFQRTDEIVQNSKEEIRLMKVYFPSQKCVILEDLIGKFHELKNSEDKLKLGLVAIVENAITGHDTRRNVDKGHFLLVDNLWEFDRYPWRKLFYKVTRDSLIRAKGKLAYHLNGFPHVFQVWITTPFDDECKTKFPNRFFIYFYFYLDRVGFSKAYQV
ncbi:hypothetical protein MKW92_027762 [Papaver armeniacum]|nr:hypothetical protein MKW92_027762 [Papaver armeniacum]